MHEGRILPNDGHVRLRVPAGATGDGGIGTRRVRNASSRHRGSRHRYGADAGLPASRNLQRPPRGDFHGDEIAPRAALPKGYSLSAKTFRAEFESGSDEGSVEFSVPRKGASNGGPADAEGHGRD